jgi:hypothetical protein
MPHRDGNPYKQTDHRVSPQRHQANRRRLRGAPEALGDEPRGLRPSSPVTPLQQGTVVQQPDNQPEQTAKKAAVFSLEVFLAGAILIAALAFLVMV